MSGGIEGVTRDAPCVIHAVRCCGAGQEPRETFRRGEPCTVQTEVEVVADFLFDFTLVLSLVRASGGPPVTRAQLHAEGWDVSWLPRGRYLVTWYTPALPAEAGAYTLAVEAARVPGGRYQPLATMQHSLSISGETLVAGNGGTSASWSVTDVQNPDGVDRLSWKKGKDDWFYKHFDHAARVVIHYMFDDAPQLRGRILDVGCGEGITDLGIFLRQRPEVLVGLDIEGNFRQLPRILQENQFPLTQSPDNLIFCRGDANRLPYADDYFDVVVSWASLEHIVGDPRRVLREIARVLKDGGLLFLHPGLYYSSIGHHLGEFTPEPFVHLKKTPEALRQVVFAAEPQFMDRSGLTYTPADFWRYYSELQKLTVAGVEQDLRLLGFEFLKVAVRAEDLVTYTPELQRYSIQDLSTQEIYMALRNRKGGRAWAGGWARTPAKEARAVGRPSVHTDRGARPEQEELRTAFAPYVRYFRNCRHVLDVACDGGEFLSLLAEQGISGVGVGANGWGSSNGTPPGTTVVTAGVFDFLRTSAEVFDGIFCPFLPERLPLVEAMDLIALLDARLTDDGVLVIVLHGAEPGARAPGGATVTPETVAAVCQHYGFIVTSAPQLPPFAVPQLPAPGSSSPGTLHTETRRRGRLREKVSHTYGGLLRRLRVVPKSDLAEQNARLAQEIDALRGTLTTWTDAVAQALNQRGGGAAPVVMICRKTLS